MRTVKTGICVAACWLLAAGCGEHSPIGFRLPDNGDADRGQRAFIQLNCYECHTVKGVELPTPRPGLPAVVQLGGAVREIRTDGYLVASIINPSHRLADYPEEQVSVEGESRMPDYADTMTVRQLVDIVAFLRPRYTLLPPPTM